MARKIHGMGVYSPVGTPFSFGSCEKEYWVFAMQTKGRRVI